MSAHFSHHKKVRDEAGFFPFISLSPWLGMGLAVSAMEAWRSDLYPPISTA